MVTNNSANYATGASGTVLTGNGEGVTPTFQAAAGTGDVVGPAGATSTAIAVYDGTTGKLIANSIPTIDSSGNILTSAALSGATLSMDVVNSSNTASSVARMSTTVAGTSAGDAVFQASVSGGQTWSFGLDNSDSDAFALSSSVALGTTNVIIASVDGEVTMPLQPAFSAILSATTASDKTGNNTIYTLICNTEIFDQGSDYDNTTGTFTAPVTGIYRFNARLAWNNIVGQDSSQLYIQTSNRNYLTIMSTFSPVGLRQNASEFCDMDDGDTCILRGVGSGQGSDTVGFIGSATNAATYFAGNLVC